MVLQVLVMWFILDVALVLLWSAWRKSQRPDEEGEEPAARAPPETRAPPYSPPARLSSTHIIDPHR
jgi:hypothetical protein